MTEAGALRIIWHLGFQKTGTTSFQAALSSSWGRLPPGVTCFPKAFHTQELQEACRSYWHTRDAESRSRVVTAASRVVARTRTRGATVALVSDENILGHVLCAEGFDIFSAASDIIPLLEQSAAPARSEFVLYTRDFDRWLVSAYNQEVRNMRCEDDFAAWAEKLPFDRSWAPNLAAIRACTDAPVHVFDLDAELKAGRAPGEAALRIAGLDDTALSRIEWPSPSNESLTPDVLAFMLDLNRSKIHAFGLNIVRTLMAKHAHIFD